MRRFCSDNMFESSPKLLKEVLYRDIKDSKQVTQCIFTSFNQKPQDYN